MVKPSVEAVRLLTHSACAKLPGGMGWCVRVCVCVCVCVAALQLCRRARPASAPWRRRAPAVHADHALRGHGPVDKGEDAERKHIGAEKHGDELPPRQAACVLCVCVRVCAGRGGGGKQNGGAHTGVEGGPPPVPHPPSPGPAGLT